MECQLAHIGSTTSGRCCKSRIYIRELHDRRIDTTGLSADSKENIYYSCDWQAKCSLSLREGLTMTLLYLAMALTLVTLVAWLINTYVPMPGNMKTIANVVLALLVVGMVLWLINTYVPMAGSIKAILNIFVVVATCVGVLQAVGLWSQVVRLWGSLTHKVRVSD